MRKNKQSTRGVAQQRRAATVDAVSLEKAMREAEDHLAGLHRMLKIAKPKGGHRMTRVMRTPPSLFEKAGMDSLGNFLASGFSRGDFASGNFQPSAQQMSSLWMSAWKQAMRIQ